ncbi:MAG TPA: hypothetical protein VJ866_19550 [Pyrinomonadaceae bacterium]|nr:hypothetical protein [Pyrinomonadaceae bacterium]
MKNDGITLEEFWGVVTSLKNDASRCSKALAATPEEDEAGRAFWRRMYARAAFAFFDGVTYRMAYHAYMARDRRGVAFSLEELNRLEKMFDFDDDEDLDIYSAVSHINMLEDMKFAFNAFARVHYTDYVLPIADADWVFMKEAAHIRNWLTHPKTAEGLEVNGGDVDALAWGMVWFVENLVALLGSSLTHTLTTFAGWDDEDDAVM